MKLRLFLSGTLLAFCVRDAQAQRSVRSVGDDFKNVAGDIVFIWTSPFHASASDWIAVAATIGATALTLPIDDDIDRWMVDKPRSPLLRIVDPFREDRKGGLGDFGTGKRIQPIAGVAYIIGVASNSRHLRDGALGCSGMQLSNTVIRKQVLYKLIARPRPDFAETIGADQYSVDVPGAEHGYHSFPAGHFMNAMGCASFLANRFHLGALEPVLYGSALAIGIGRQADRRHWTSDGVIGLVMGYSIGRTIAHRQLKRLGGTSSSRGASLGAGVENGAPRYTFTWRAEF